MIPVNQNYMGRGWSAEEREAARQEATLAHPQWENAASSVAVPRHGCVRDGLRWIGDDPCWMCGKPGEDIGFTPRPGMGAQRRYPAYDQPATPASGCGCDDPTVLRVAELEPVLGLWKACLEVYGNEER